jgi:hypothetical protein
MPFKRCSYAAHGRIRPALLNRHFPDETVLNVEN